jgi:hypothetical protein
MRRWLAILLLVLMPAQFTWAAMARYCPHETDATASHWGHHDVAGHGHDTAPAVDGDAATADTDAATVDCHHCHGPAGLIGALAAPAPRLPDGAPAPQPAPARAEPVPTQPERPQWAALA